MMVRIKTRVLISKLIEEFNCVERKTTRRVGKGDHVNFICINAEGKPIRIVIPLHKELKHGTFNAIVNALAKHFGIPKKEVIKILRDP